MISLAQTSNSDLDRTDLASVIVHSSAELDLGVRQPVSDQDRLEVQLGQRGKIAESLESSRVSVEDCGDVGQI